MPSISSTPAAPDQPERVLPRESGLARAEERMRRALEVARTTPAGDVPVGAVIYGPDGRELATGVNRREQRQDPIAHAEVEAIRDRKSVV